MFWAYGNVKYIEKFKPSLYLEVTVIREGRVVKSARLKEKIRKNR